MEPKCKTGGIYFCYPFSLSPQTNSQPFQAFLLLSAFVLLSNCCNSTAGVNPLLGMAALSGLHVFIFSYILGLPICLVCNVADLGQVLWRHAILIKLIDTYL